MVLRRWESIEGNLVLTTELKTLKKALVDSVGIKGADLEDKFLL